jgi:curved DNA-binding protein CbpA
MTDPHSVLGVPKGANGDEIKALKKLAMKYHPDKNPDNPEIATEKLSVSEAYDALTKQPSEAEEHLVRGYVVRGYVVRSFDVYKYVQHS